jgi:hypothetical protein
VRLMRIALQIFFASVESHAFVGLRNSILRMKDRRYPRERKYLRVKAIPIVPMVSNATIPVVVRKEVAGSVILLANPAMIARLVIIAPIATACRCVSRISSDETLNKKVKAVFIGASNFSLCQPRCRVARNRCPAPTVRR